MRDVPQAPQTDPLDEARRQFKRWRNRRPHSRSRIPEELWTLAVQAAQEHGVYQFVQMPPGPECSCIVGQLGGVGQGVSISSVKLSGVHPLD